MYTAINVINATISNFDFAVKSINDALKEREYGDILDENYELYPSFKEILDPCQPHEFLSSLEAVFLHSNCDPVLVEEVYVARIESAFSYIIGDILVCSKLVSNIIKSCGGQEKQGVVDVKKYLDAMWLLVDDILSYVAIFFDEVLEKEVSFDTIDKILEGKITSQTIFNHIRFLEDKYSSKLKPGDLEFIKNLAQFGEEEEVFEATEMQLKQLAVQKKLPPRFSRKIKFIKKRCGADAYRMAKVFNLSFEQANAAFDLGDVKLSVNNNPKYNINTSFDDFFRSQYDQFFKDEKACTFSFDYCF